MAIDKGICQSFTDSNNNMINCNANNICSYPFIFVATIFTTITRLYRSMTKYFYIYVQVFICTNRFLCQTLLLQIGAVFCVDFAAAARVDYAHKGTGTACMIIRVKLGAAAKTHIFVKSVGTYCKLFSNTHTHTHTHPKTPSPSLTHILNSLPPAS